MKQNFEKIKKLKIMSQVLQVSQLIGTEKIVEVKGSIKSLSKKYKWDYDEDDLKALPTGNTNTFFYFPKSEKNKKYKTHHLFSYADGYSSGAFVLGRSNGQFTCYGVYDVRFDDILKELQTVFNENSHKEVI